MIGADGDRLDLTPTTATKENGHMSNGEDLGRIVTGQTNRTRAEQQAAEAAKATTRQQQTETRKRT